MYRKLDNKGQSSAEVILILGGLLAIVLFVASYITNITTTTNNSFKELITQEKDFLINKI
ncbi:MAG: class III signal peptide-containing protein [Methanobrevibacter sp.]|nr:class III signal peptide-containing protein [Methanobrevibacter sp.]